MFLFARFSSFLFRLLITSIMALCIQIGLFVKLPNWLLLVQEAIKQGTVWGFEQISLQSSYRVAFNLLNGDGILVHTVFVMLSFAFLYLLFLPVRLVRRK